MEKKESLAKFLECELEDLDEAGDFCGLEAYSNGSEEYAIGTDEEADEACQEYIKNSAWAFNSDFILASCGLDFSGEESLKQMQENSSEGANDFILSLIEKTCGLEEFTNDAIAADGRGHFLSGYDGTEETEGEFFIYRTN